MAMASAAAEFYSPTNLLLDRVSGEVVGLTDVAYDLRGLDHEGSFEEVSVKGDLSQDLAYNGYVIRIVSVDSFIGLVVDHRGARGPLWRGVKFHILEKP